MKKAIITLWLLVSFSLAFSVQVQSSAPQLINYQGRVTDSAGVPLDGPFDIVQFAIYDADSAGNAIWFEEHTTFVVTDGLFSVLLGSVTELVDTVFNDTTRYLGISLDGGVSEVMPRTRLVTAPYAFRVNTVDGASGGTISGDVSIQSDLAVNGIIDATGMSSKIRFHYNALGDLPDPTVYHGMLAHVHLEGKAFYAHDGAWVPLANEIHIHGWADDGNAVRLDNTNDSVGIGVSTPSAKLHLEGDLLFGIGNHARTAVPSKNIIMDNGTNDSPGITFFYADHESFGIDGHTQSGGGMRIVEGLGEPAGTVRMFIKKGGNVGIGTVTPTEVLEVAGTVYSTSGGFKFPDNTVQTTAAAGGGASGWTDDGTVVRLDAVGDSVGIGTSTPSEMLEVAGNILVTGKANIGTGNSNSGINSFVVGETNTASGYRSTVTGGFFNFALDSNGTVGGGRQNGANAVSSTIAGGHGNIVSVRFGSIGGGFQNAATNTAATVSGGNFGIASGNYSTIGGGSFNKARGIYSVVSGGGGATEADSNAAIGDYSNIGGGTSNIATGNHSTIGGGLNDSASGTESTIAGGTSNIASGGASAIGGGFSNQATMLASTVAGGYQNRARGDYATILGGLSNDADGAYAIVLGGRFARAEAKFSLAAGWRARAMHTGSFVFADSSASTDFTSSTSNEFNIRAAGGTRIYSNGALTTGVTLAAGAGAWVAVSDSSVKRNIRPVDEYEILEKVSQLPVSRWSYETQSPEIEHIGPMAQDFYAAFGLGEDEKGICTIDPDGISLAAIKALYEENKKLKVAIVDLQARMIELLEKVKEIERIK